MVHFIMIINQMILSLSLSFSLSLSLSLFVWKEVEKFQNTSNFRDAGDVSHFSVKEDIYVGEEGIIR